MSEHKPLGAQISHFLAGKGTEVIFGIPGVHNQELYRGIEEAGLTHVLARHEQGAGFMADGYARATGRAGVAYVITGPGLCNILTPLGQAYSDSVPVLVISSCLDDVTAQQGQLHQMRDQRAAAATVCDWSEEAPSAAGTYHLIERALAEFAATRPRPKHIQVPIGLLEAEAEPGPSTTAPVTRPECTAGDLDRVAQAVRIAQRPLCILGRGATGVPIQDLLQRIGAAAFTTTAANGLVPLDYPLNFGSYLARKGAADVIAGADLVLALGTELAEVDLWRVALGHTSPLVRVDIDPLVLTDRHRQRYQCRAVLKAVWRACWRV